MPNLFAGVRKGNIRVIFVIVAVILAIVALAFYTGSAKFSVTLNESNSDKPKPQTLQQKTPVSYKNDTNGFSLKYPESWTVKEGTTSDPVVSFISQKENSSDNFTENLFVTVTDLSSKPGLSSSEVMAQWIKENKAGPYASTFTISSQEPVVIGGLNAEQLVYTFSESGYDIKGMMTIVMKNNKAYLLSYTAEAKSFGVFINEINAIVDSFIAYP